MAVRGFLLLVGAMALFLAALAPAGAAAPAVAIVTSEHSPDYVEAIEAIGAELARGGYSRSDLTVISASELTSLALSSTSPRLIVALGTPAAQALARTESKAPQLFALLTRHSFENLYTWRKTPPPHPVSAVYLDQPISRQLDLLRLALPELRRIGVLLGPASQSLAPKLERAAAERGLRLASAQVEDSKSLYAGLQQVVNQADILLAIADPLVFNANTIQNILLTTFRARVPLFAFSPAYVKAGALLAIYSTPGQFGAQAGVIARAFLQGKPLPAPQYPVAFTVSANPHVARSLGLSLDETALSKRLSQMEKPP